MAKPWSGSGVGPYRFEGKLGSGASGTVYRAVDGAGRRAAVKVLHGQVDDPDLRERFRREAQLGIAHPNVVRVLGAGFADGDVPYIAFELLEGESLEARLARGRLTAPEVVRLGRQACAGLAAAHAMGIVHRDLKPANLFITREGTLKVLDFGVALATARATRLTQAAAIMGTPAYLSPEQARGLRDLDARTDIWALGAILYEAASGRIPFARDTVFATLVAIRKDEVPPLGAVAPGLPAGLVAVIERALDKDRGRRWPGIIEMDRALAALEAKPASRQTIVPDQGPTFTNAETRVLAMLLAHEVNDVEAIRRAVEREGGRFLTLRGARALGLFGMQTWVGDEATRAVRAGLEARAAAGPMAVSAGQATLDGDRLGGPALDAAKRGCQAGLAGIVVDQETARGLGSHLTRREHPGGLAEITTGRPSARSMPVAREVGELVGRDAELARVRAALDAAAHRRHASALVLTGPPGIGKSRLCQEAERLARAHAPGLGGGPGGGGQARFRVFAGSGVRHHRESALGLARALLMQELRRSVGGGELALDDLPMAERRRAVVELVGEVAHAGLDAGACVEALSILFGVDVAPSATLQAALRDPHLMVERLRAGVLAYFEAALGRSPVVILIEDLQWVDDASIELFEELFVRHQASPLLVVATSRESAVGRRPVFEGGNVTRVELGGLGPVEVSRLAQLTLGRRLPEAALRQLAQHTAGNPLFVTHIVGALSDAQIAAASEGGALPLPLSVRAAVQSRIDQLDAGDKRVCKAAAIFERAFYADELTALGLPEPSASLAALVDRGVLATRGRPHPTRGAQHRFQSQLTAEVAWGMLTPDARRELHQRLAEHLARAPDGRPEEAARHFERGGLTEPAARHYHAACLAAARVGDARRALACADKALALGVAPDALFTLQMARADALRFEGRRQEHADALAAALAAATDDAQRARAWCDEAWRMLHEGLLERAADVAEQAEGAARAAGDDEVLVRALGCRVVVLLDLGVHAEAEGIFAEAAAIAATTGPHVRAQVELWRARLAAARQEPSERHRALQDALSLYREAGDAARAAGVSIDLAELHNRLGRYEDAADELQVAIDDCRQVGNRAREGYGWAHLAYALGMMRRSGEAWNALEESLQLARDLGDPRLELTCELARARLWAAHEDPAEVASLAEAVAVRAAELGEPGVRAASLALAARAWVGAGAPDRALQRAQQAMAIRDARDGVEDDEALVYVALAEALLANDMAIEADEVRATGIARVEEVAGRIVDPVWRDAFLRCVPSHRALFGEPLGGP